MFPTCTRIQAWSMMYIIGFVARQNNLVSDLREDCMNAEAYDDDTVNAKDLCYYEAYVREHVFRPLLSKSKDSFMGFRPEKSLWARCAPTWNDTETGFPGECRYSQSCTSRWGLWWQCVCGWCCWACGVVRLFLSFSLKYNTQHTPHKQDVASARICTRNLSCFQMNATT